MISFGIRKQQKQPRFAAPAYASAQPRRNTPDRTHMDYVTLADGSTVAVPRANLAASKALLAAQKAAERRIALADAQQRQAVVTIRELPVVAHDERMAS